MKSTEIRSQNVTLLFNILGLNREPDPYSIPRPDHPGRGGMSGIMVHRLVEAAAVALLLPRLVQVLTIFREMKI